MREAHTVKIRKPRPCDWCGEWFEKGERATSYGCKNYELDEIQTVTMHPECYTRSAENHPEDYYNDDMFMLHENKRPTPETP